MSLGALTPEVREVSGDVYAYLQPDGTWYLNNTGFLVSRTGVVSVNATFTERRTRAYLELDGGERGAPADIASAFIDMITYNGGQPLTCHA